MRIRSLHPIKDRARILELTNLLGYLDTNAVIADAGKDEISLDKWSIQLVKNEYFEIWSDRELYGGVGGGSAGSASASYGNVQIRGQSFSGALSSGDIESSVEESEMQRIFEEKNADQEKNPGDCYIMLDAPMQTRKKKPEDATSYQTHRFDATSSFFEDIDQTPESHLVMQEKRIFGQVVAVLLCATDGPDADPAATTLETSTEISTTLGGNYARNFC